MKRIFPIVISMVLLCSMLFSGCSETPQAAISTKDLINNNYALLTETITGENDKATFAETSEMIAKWAGENDMTVAASGGNYLIIKKDKSVEADDIEDFTFHTALDYKDAETSHNSIESAVAVMSLMMDPLNHGNLTAIFTEIKSEIPVGAENIDPQYLETDNFIDLTYGEDTELYNTFAAISNMNAVKDLTLSSPQYTEAYKITFKGIENHSAYKDRGTYPNPIKTIGDLLAACQTSTILFELADFNGGSVSDMIPSKVSATIVIHENDVESFIKKFDNSFKKVDEHYEDTDAEFEYTYEPVDLPSTVICKEDTENIVSLMYTMINGTYLRNDKDEVEAVSNIGKISTANDTFRLTINAKSLNDETMTEIHGVVKTICGLSDMKYKLNSSTKVWTNAADTPLVAALTDITNAEPASALEMKHIAPIIEANNNINLISWSTNMNEADKAIEKIFEYASTAGIQINE